MISLVAFGIIVVLAVLTVGMHNDGLWGREEDDHYIREMNIRMGEEIDELRRDRIVLGNSLASALDNWKWAKSELEKLRAELAYEKAAHAEHQQVAAGIAERVRKAINE